MATRLPRHAILGKEQTSNRSETAFPEACLGRAECLSLVRLALCWPLPLLLSLRAPLGCILDALPASVSKNLTAVSVRQVK